MKLDLTKLSEYEKLVTIASPKTGMRKKDSLYFNFQEKKIFIHSDYMVAYINFDFTADENEEYQNVFFDTKKLFIIHPVGFTVTGVLGTDYASKSGFTLAELQGGGLYTLAVDVKLSPITILWIAL